jgi:hypothetical protein
LVATVVPWTSAATAARSVFEHGQPGDEADRLVLGGRSHLGDAEHAALRIERQQIGERAADIGADLPCHPLFLAALGRSRASVLQILLRKRRRLFQVHAAVIDRRRTGGRTRVLHEENGPAGRRRHFMLEVQVRHIGNRARAVELSGKREFALDDVQTCAKYAGAAERTRPPRILEIPHLVPSDVPGAGETGIW